MATAGFETGAIFAKKFNISVADQKSQELLETFSARIQPLFVSTMQSPYEVAEVVKNIILCEKPHLRYQMNDKYNPEEVKAKLADPTGNVLVEMVKKTFFDAE